MSSTPVRGSGHEAIATRIAFPDCLNFRRCHLGIDPLEDPCRGYSCDQEYCATTVEGVQVRPAQGRFF